MWLPTRTFSLAFVRYAFIPRAAKAALPGRLLRAGEAERVLARALADQALSAQLRRVYADLSHELDISRIQNEVVLARLTAWVGRGDGPLMLVELGGETRGGASTVDSETRQIEEALRKLGRLELQHRGHGYRIVLAERAAQEAERARYEAVSPREAREVVAGVAGDPSRAAEQRAVLAELLASIERLLVLRRLLHVAASEERPVVTPSQLRESRPNHYIEVMTTDDSDRPVSGVGLEILLAQGGTTVVITDKAGVARLDSVAPGTISIRVLSLDASKWRPASGPAAQRGTKRGGARTHVVKKGENLTRIALAHGLKDWKMLWDAPENEALRAKRKSPHVIHPGDEVHVPDAAVFEIIRETDATHRIVITSSRPMVGLLNLHVLKGVEEVNTAWHGGSSTLAATAPIFQDDTSAALRLHDVPTRWLALSASSTGDASDNDSSEPAALA